MEKESDIRAFDPARYIDSRDAAVAYLEELVMADDPALFLQAVREIADSRGMTALAEETGLTRQGLYKALGENGDPRLSTVLKIVNALGLRVSLMPADVTGS